VPSVDEAIADAVGASIFDDAPVVVPLHGVK